MERHLLRISGRSATRKIGAALVAAAGAASAGVPEARVQECLCAGMAKEWSVPGGGRADCLSARHAIEIDDTANWAQAIGQALYYAAETGREPKIILYCEESLWLCLKHQLRIQSTIAAYDLPITLELHDQQSLRAECPGL